MIRRTPVEISAVITNYRILKKTPVSNVLAIDDEEGVLVTVTKMLERLGYAVIPLNQVGEPQIPKERDIRTIFQKSCVQINPNFGYQHV